MDPRPNRDPILSDFAADPDMKDLLDLFVSDLPERVERIQEAWERDNFEQLCRIAHQLKGACGGYGYTVIGDAAGRLETTLKKGPTDLDVARAELDALIDLCQRAQA